MKKSTLMNQRPFDGSVPVTLEWIRSNCLVNAKGCWEWQGAKDSKGYGQVSVNRQMKRVHRIAYILSVGEIGDDLKIRHTCDNRPCCNPNHLEEGTQEDNVHDTIERGRANYWFDGSDRHRGESHSMAKLNEQKVLAIRSEYATGNISQAKLAIRYEVTQALIQLITSRKIWKHI